MTMTANETPKEVPSLLISTDAAAKLWGISRWTIYDLVKQGRIRPIIGLGKGWKFLPSDIGNIEFTRL